MDRPLKLLYLIDEMESIAAGGTERQLLQMIQLVKAAGIHVELAVFRGTQWLTPEEAGCPIHRADVPAIGTYPGLQALARLRRWIRAQGFDVVQTFFVESNLFGQVVARLAGVPLVLGSRRNLNYWMRPRTAFFQGISNRFATRLVANSAAVKTAVARSEWTSPAKIDVIYNGLDLSVFRRSSSSRSALLHRYGIPADGQVVGCIASLRPIKGTEHFIEASALVLQQVPQAWFFLVGEGPLRSVLERRIAERGIGKRCLIVGAQSDVLPFLSAFDIAVLPSDSEGFSNSLLEYMAVGLPVVATDVGENRAVLAEDAGLVVPPQKPPALADAIIRLLQDHALAARLGARAAEKAKDFSLEATQERLANYYYKLVLERRK